ncbi:MAG: inclusion body family protein [Polaribacter sp.]|nr:inclusion body family protein [Polaribacter sp.]
MKNLFYLFILLFAFSINAQTKHTITLNVDTSNITNGNISQTCDFGQDEEISNENFTIQVSIGDIVEWVGVSTSSSEDTVEIISINHEGGARVFDRNILRDNNGVVTGVVSSGRPGDYQKYNVKFRVYRNGSRLSGVFKIDPKIIIKQ